MPSLLADNPAFRGGVFVWQPDSQTTPPAVTRRHRFVITTGLVNTLNDANAENDLSRRDGLLQELRALAAAHPADAAVREGLSKGLAVRLLAAREDGEPAPVQEALVTELTPLLPHINEGLRGAVRKEHGL